MQLRTAIWPGGPLPDVVANDAGGWRRASSFALAVSATTGAVGIGLAWRAGLVSTFVSQWPSYLATFGCGWATYWYVWAVRCIPTTVREGGSTVLVHEPGQPSVQPAVTELDRLSERARSFPAAILALEAVVVIAYEICALRWLHRLPGFPTLASKHSTWVSDPHIVCKAALIALWTVALLVPMTAAALLAIKYFIGVARFASTGRHTMFLGEVPIAREAFRRITYFPLWGGLAWTGGGLFIALSLVDSLHRNGLRGNVEPVVVVSVLVMFGVAGILWPEWLFHRVLDEMKRRQFEKHVREMRSAEQNGESDRVDDLTDRIRTICGQSPWVHAYGAAINVSTQIVIPIAPVLIAAIIHSSSTST